MMAPHGTSNGPLGLAALVHVCATMPHNLIAFEYPAGSAGFWHEIVDGLPSPIVRDGMIDVWDAPGLGITVNADKAKAYLDDG